MACVADALCTVSEVCRATRPWLIMMSRAVRWRVLSWQGAYGGVYAAKVHGSAQAIVVKVAYPDADLHPEQHARNGGVLGRDLNHLHGEGGQGA